MRTVKTKVAKPAIATKIGVLMTRVKFTASSNALILPVQHTGVDMLVTFKNSYDVRTGMPDTCHG